MGGGVPPSRTFSVTGVFEPFPYFSTDFHTKSAKFLTELFEDPNNLRKIKTWIIKKKKGTIKAKNPLLVVAKKKVVVIDRFSCYCKLKSFSC